MPLPPDLHVHTEWSWDAPHGSMERSCERALELGLPAIAFTEHADWALVHEGQHSADLAAYFDSIEPCLARFTDLRIPPAAPPAQPHCFPQQTTPPLASGP